MSIVAPVTAAACAPPSRRALIATRLRWAARLLGGLVIAAWSLLLVAWLTLHWGILPHIQQWRPQIEQRATSALGVPVRIGQISVRSSGWVPTLELHDVVLLDAESRPALQLPRVVAALSPRSLLTLELRFTQLLVEGPQLEVRRDAQGRIFVAGLAIGGPGRSDRAAQNWFFKQPEFVIRGGSLRWTDEQRDAPPLALSDVRVVVRNGLRRHSMRLDATPPADWGDRFSLNARFSQPLLEESGDWSHWSGTLYADLPRADVAQLRRYMTLPFDLDEGDGAVRAWMDVQDGQPLGVTADVALREVTLRLGRHVQPLVLSQIEGRLAARHDQDTWALSAHQFGFVTGDGIRWPRSDISLRWRQSVQGNVDSGQFDAGQLDLALVAQIAERVPLGESVRRLLAEVQPRGMLGGLSARWTGPIDAPATYHVKGVLGSLSLAAKAAPAPDEVGRPGLRNATVVLDATEKGGNARVDISDGGIELPGVFEDPVVHLARLGGNLQWSIQPAGDGAPPAVSVQAREVRFNNDDAAGELSGQWSTGPGQTKSRGGRYPGLIELSGKISQGQATRVARYLPLGIPEDTRRYVAHAVQSGRVENVSFRVKGDLRDFPFNRLNNPTEGEFRIAGQVVDADFAYVPVTPDAASSGNVQAVATTWPPFNRLSGELVFDRASMEIRNAQASVYGVTLSQVNGGIRQLGDHPVLAIRGQVHGPLQDLLRYVGNSPVGEWLGSALAQARGNGPADLKLALDVPLQDVERTTVKGNLALAGNDVRLAPDLPLLANARARIDFTDQGLSVAGGAARVLGGDATFEGGTQADGSLRFNGRGIATADGLRRAVELGAVSRLATSLSGQSAYRLALGVIHGHTELSVDSTLVGMASDLPAPLRKSADSPLALHYQTALDARTPATGQIATDTMRLELGRVVRAQFQRDLSGQQPRVLRGSIGVLDTPPVSSDGVAASINIPELDVDAWQGVTERLTDAGGVDAGGASNGYVPGRIALRAGELSASGRRLTHLVAGLTREDDRWHANLDADQLNGYAEYTPGRADRGGPAPGRIYARLSRLSLPESEADSVETMLDRPTATVPSLDIVVDDLELRSKRLGRVEIEANNRTVAEGHESVREWQLARLTMTVPEARFVGSGRWASGSASGDRRRATLDFKLDIADSGALLARLGTPDAVKGGKGNLTGQLSWLGSPLSLDYPSLGGKVNVDIDSGQFLKVKPGAARLLSVLSLQSLPRRLALDFRDLFQQGFAFDNLTGDLSIEHGVAHSNNLRMRGVQAAVLMEGSADIENETQDLRVVVVPEINAGTASLAYAAINPAIGLGTFLAQLFLRKPLVRAGTREFHVTGPWSDPKVERVEHDAKDVPRTPDFDASAPNGVTNR